ncbi:MAG: helix-hairpin-helix domain-containing protein [Planctomycetota bacterium]|nr:helix-hairpin-helix domain-containing protein [Planctomycetota bacterium]
MNQNRPKTAAELHRFYVAARSHFGYTSRWWPGTPMELTVTAVLVQQCDWTVAWKAAKRLRDAGLLNLMHLAESDAATVTELIQTVAFPRQKAARLIQIAGRLVTGGFATIEELLQSGSTEQVRQQLLALPGIGDETADSMLLFAADHHETFVVDAYARRLFQRLNLFDGCAPDFWQLPYERLRRFFLDHVTDFLPLYDGLELAVDLPRSVALLRDFHAQIVELGRHHCRKTRPRCVEAGWPGWTDEDGDFTFCDDHCSQNGCMACPLSGSCAANT